MKKSPYLIALMLLLLVNISTKDHPVNHTDHDSYESWLALKLKEIPELQQEKIEKIPKFDRPDLAAMQNFYQTIDPELGYVPHQRLREAYRLTRSMMQLKSLQLNAASLEWESVPARMGGRTRALMFDPNDAEYKKVWAAGITGGLWVNNDITSQSSLWNPEGDFWENLSISCLAYDPNNTQVFYAGTGEAQTARIIYRESSGLGDGIYKSTDGGNSWEKLTSTEGFKYVTDLVVADENGQSVVYAAVVSGVYMGPMHDSDPSDGLFRSTDGGESWEQVLPNIPGQFYTRPYAPSDIEITSDGRIFVGTMENIFGDGGAVILRSDLGTPNSWSVNDYYNQIISIDGYFNIPARTLLASAPSDPDQIYAQFAAGYIDNFTYFRGRIMAKSTNAGDSWSTIPIPDLEWATLAWHAFALEVSPQNPDIVYSGGLDLWQSLDGGQNWQRVSDWSLMYSGGGDDYVHADQHTIVFRPENANQAVFTTDGGVFYSANALSSNPVFQQHNSRFNTLQFYTCAIHPSAGQNNYLGGLQDNGTLLYMGGVLDINDMISGGDGAYCFWDENEPSFIIASVYYNNYSVFVNGNEFNYFGGSSGTFVSPADYDFENNNLYSNAVTFGGQYPNHLLRVKGIPTISSEQLVNIGTNSQVPFSHVKFAQNSDESGTILYVGTAAGKLYRIEQAESFPQAFEITAPEFPDGSVSCVAVTDDPDKLLVTFSNYGVPSVWMTEDGGQSWIEKESNLPDMPIRWAIFHPYNDDQVMLATETGIWTTNTLGEEETLWEPDVAGMANVRVDMLKLRRSDLTVLAATHGRGLFTTHFPLDVYVSTLERELTGGMKVYPNPASNTLLLEFETADSQDYQIIEASGRTVLSGKTTGKLTTINISHLEAGLYVLLTGNKPSQQLKFLVK